MERKLTAGTYTFPADCKASVHDGIITIVPKKRKFRCRCRTCRYFSRGIATAGGRVTDICLLRPKVVKWHSPDVDSGEIYFAIRPTNKSCDQYAPRTIPYDIADHSEYKV